MALIVENGSSLPNANSYISLVDARAYALTIGLDLPVADQDCEAALLKAMPYIESFEYQGHKADIEQALKFPRNQVYLYGYLLSNDVIPDILKKAQVTASSLVYQGVDLLPTISGQFVKRERVGPIETDYSDQYLPTSDGMPVISEIYVYIKPLTNWRSGYRMSPSFGF